MDPLTFDSAMAAWLNHLQATRKSPATVAQYRQHLEWLQAWLAEWGITHPADLTPNILEAWLADINSRWAAATVRLSVNVARSFIRWLRDARIIKKKQRKKLLKALRPPPVTQNVQRTLTIAEIEKLLAACDAGSAKGIRDLAMVSLLIDSGLRSGEIRGLQVNQIEFRLQLEAGIEINRVLVTGKGGGTDYGYFGQRTAGYLHRWLEVREMIAGPEVNEVFVAAGGNTPGQVITRYGLRTIMVKLGRKAGVEDVTPHAFRRSFACLLEMAGASTRVTQALGRWEQMEMVKTYTRNLEAARLYGRFAPMDRFFGGQG